jgi:hypothetical protein
MKHQTQAQALVTKLMKQWAPPERTQLIAQLGISRITWYRWQNNPGIVPVPEADIIRQFLQEAFGEKYDLIELFRVKPRRRKSHAA